MNICATKHRKETVTFQANNFGSSRRKESRSPFGNETFTLGASFPCCQRPNRTNSTGLNFCTCWYFTFSTTVIGTEDRKELRKSRLVNRVLTFNLQISSKNVNERRYMLCGSSKSNNPSGSFVLDTNFAAFCKPLWTAAERKRENTRNLLHPQRNFT